MTEVDYSAFTVEGFDSYTYLICTRCKVTVTETSLGGRPATPFQVEQNTTVAQWYEDEATLSVILAAANAHQHRLNL